MPIQGTKKKDRIKELFKNITEYDIFRTLLGIDFKVGASFCNPIRGENHPSAIINSCSTGLKMKDYTDERFNGGPIDLWMFLNNVDLIDALNQIENHFNLNTPLKKVNITWKQPEIIKKQAPFFQILTTSPSREQLKYWEEHYQGLEDLKRENIYFPKEIRRNKVKIPITIMTFCYFYPEIQAWKIYRPYGKMGKDVWYSERKWDSSIPNDYMENKSSIVHQDKALIATSKKDRMVLQSALEIDNIANIQAENIEAINDEDMLLIKNTTKEQYICGDRDDAGKKFSWLLTKEYDFKHINPRDDRPKDFADWAKEYGLKEVKHHFKNKNVIE